MKVLLDENLPHELRLEVPGHDVFTVQYMGWSGAKNGLLLKQAAAAGFDVMITMDSGVPYQQNISSLRLEVVVLSAASNDIEDLRPLLPRLRETLNAPIANTVVKIE
jgi:hypothetical protein